MEESAKDRKNRLARERRARLKAEKDAQADPKIGGGVEVDFTEVPASVSLNIPKREKSRGRYRGADNPGNPHTPNGGGGKDKLLTRVPMKLERRRKPMVRPGGRVVTHKWVPA